MNISHVCREYIPMLSLTQNEGDFSLLSSFNYPLQVYQWFFVLSQKLRITLIGLYNKL